MNCYFMHIGNDAYLDAYKVKYIVDADNNKAARMFAKAGIKRDDPRVFDATSNKETRSVLILNDNTFGISSVSAKVLRNRANRMERPNGEIFVNKNLLLSEGDDNFVDENYDEV